MHGDGLKVALVHASVDWGEKEKNLARLLDLNEKAAGAGARVILNTEMAVTGYSFASRAEIAPLAETIPGPATRALGRIAGNYGCYICVGLPEVDRKTGVFYNAAALIGPAGRVVGKCRKLAPAYRENLWAARGNLPVLVTQTEFGRLGVLICADTYSYKPARAAALKGARVLLVPANWPPEHHNPEKFWRARAAENGVCLLACNRTGMDKGMDCRNAESFIIDRYGSPLQQVSSPGDTIIYGSLPLVGGKFAPPDADGFPGRRKPNYYSDIALDIYSQFNPGAVLGLPEPAEFTVATVQFQPEPGSPLANTGKIMGLIDRAAAMSEARGRPLDLVVLPELCTTGIISDPVEAENLGEEIPGRTTEILARAAAEKNVYIALGMAESQGGKQYNSCVLIGPRGVECKYRKVHLAPRDQKWAEEGDGIFPVCDLPFGRIGLVAGCDLMFPECAESLAKRGADLLCAPALWEDGRSKFIWEARLGEQTHLAVANQWGDAGGLNTVGGSAIFGYSRFPEKMLRSESPAKGDAINVLCLNSADAREKKFLENIDYDAILNNTPPGQ
ncbi:MAG: carbon-nitrogen hydrolase family protein [Firmicutes bacterium]|nr:carbon-nitrogen hydrolase family protein [Bacillota bacterium]